MGYITHRRYLDDAADDKPNTIIAGRSIARSHTSLG
jgi:hypothetical protein